MRRRLALQKETLTELVTDDLSSVRGGQAPTSPLADCVSDRVAACNSILRTCVTFTCTR